MKNLLNQIISIFLLTFLLIPRAQSQVYDILTNPSLNYFEMQQASDSVIKHMAGPKSDDQNREVKMYNRWNWFWQYRHGNQGDFTTYARAMKKYEETRTSSLKSTLPVLFWLVQVEYSPLSLGTCLSSNYFPTYFC